MQQNDLLLTRENEKILKDRAQRFLLSEKKVDLDIEEMIVFIQNGTQYAVPLVMLAEIRALSRITPLPLISDYILGVINVRGRIMPVYRFSRSATREENGFALVGATASAHVSIWADDILGAMTVSKSEIKPAPVSFSQNFIRGVSSSGMVFIDLEKFVNDKKFYMA